MIRLSARSSFFKRSKTMQSIQDRYRIIQNPLQSKSTDQDDDRKSIDKRDTKEYIIAPPTVEDDDEQECLPLDRDIDEPERLPIEETIRNCNISETIREEKSFYLSIEQMKFVTYVSDTEFQRLCNIRRIMTTTMRLNRKVIKNEILILYQDYFKRLLRMEDIYEVNERLRNALREKRIVIHERLDNMMKDIIDFTIVFTQRWKDKLVEEISNLSNTSSTDDNVTEMALKIMTESNQDSDIDRITESISKIHSEYEKILHSITMSMKSLQTPLSVVVDLQNTNHLQKRFIVENKIQNLKNHDI